MQFKRIVPITGIYGIVRDSTTSDVGCSDAIL